MWLTHTHTHNTARNTLFTSATLRSETKHHLKTAQAEEITANGLRQEISGLQEKIIQARALLEKKEMEAKQAIEQRAETDHHAHTDVSVYETKCLSHAVKCPWPTHIHPSRCVSQLHMYMYM